jgi:pilus assembly protein FimV
MKRKLVPILAALALACPHGALALALGDIKVRSGLNEPLDAEIDLLSVDADQLADLRVNLASAEEFRRAGVERPYLLTRLRFEVQDRGGGKAALRVTSQQPVREPFLNFLIQLNWPKGRLVREYTVLLDPPVYAGAASSAVRAPVAQAQPAPAVPAPAVAPPPAREPPRVAERAPAPARATGATRDTYGPVAAGDTLWRIANRVRPDRSVSPQKMMLALLRANPEAFLQDNVNALRAGQVLRIPDREAIDALTQDEAMAELRRQETAWQEHRQSAGRRARPAPVGAAAAAPKPAPAAAPEATAPASPSAAPEPQTRLEIVAAGTSEGGAGGPSADGLRREMTLLQEELDGQRLQVSELRSRLAEAETLIQDLQRLVKLKDETLAALQQQAVLAEAAAGQPEPAPALGEGPTLPGEEARPQAPEEVAPGAEGEGVPGVAPSAAPFPPPLPVVAPEGEAPAASPVTAAVPEAQAPVPAGALTPVEAPSAPAPTWMESLASNPTLFWGGVAGLLALVGGLLSLRRRQEVVQPSPESLQEDSVSTVPATGREVPEEAPTAPAKAEPAEPAEPTSETSRGEDPMAEVNVYLAYERFEQAEELVRRAIEAYPDRHEYRLKLLEIHYAAKNAEAFEADAGPLRAAVGDHSPLMARARAWWADLNPGWPLFAYASTAALAPLAPGYAAGTDAEATRGLREPESPVALARAAFPGAAPVRPGVERPSTVVDFDLGLEGEAVEANDGTTAFDLDLNPAAGDTEATAPGAGSVDLDVSDEALAAMMSEATQSLDLDLATGQSDSVDAGLAKAAGAVARDASAPLDLDLELEAPDLRVQATRVAPLELEPRGAPPPVGAADTARTLVLEAPGEPPSGLDLEPGSVITAHEPEPWELDAPGAEEPSVEVPGLDLAGEAPDAAPLRSAAACPSGEAATRGVPEEVLETLRAEGVASPGRVGASEGALPEVDFELELDTAGGDAANAFLEQEGELSLDEVGTKLDLARAYIDMGDTEGARGILSEVLSEGNDNQRGEAKELLARLAS